MVGVIDETCLTYPFGTRIKVGDNLGTVKFSGEVFGHTGTWLGVEWDNAQRGKHDGCIEGKRYFQTQNPTAGSFIRIGKVGPFESIEEAARERYHGYSVNSVDQALIRDAQQLLQAPLFEVVGMEKIARKQSKFEQLTDVSVDGCPVNAAGYLKDFVMLTTLNLSRTLIWNWETLADVAKQVPTLVNLNLSCNRLLLPTEAQIAELEPAFRHLQYINLSSCGFTNWSDVVQTARLWPYIHSVGLQENAIAELSVVDCNEVFKNLRELDLHRTKIMDFDQICKLGNIKTLNSLNLMENGIEEIKLPDCEPHEKLQIFASLEQLNILYNPIWNEVATFNELDKLPKLRQLNKTPHLKSDFDEMFANAVAMIANLAVINKTKVTPEERRGAEYDIWKKYALEWVQTTAKSPEALHEFYKKHRSYANIIKKYGSPADFIPNANGRKPQSNLIQLRIKNQNTAEIWEKKVPRKITVQTLQGLIMKRFHLEQGSMPQLCYHDVTQPDLLVALDNTSKTLDFYSLQDNDTVVVKW